MSRVWTPLVNRIGSAIRPGIVAAFAHSAIEYHAFASWRCTRGAPTSRAWADPVGPTPRPSALRTPLPTDVLALGTDMRHGLRWVYGPIYDNATSEPERHMIRCRSSSAENCRSRSKGVQRFRRTNRTAAA
jgi:hypothetical protein